MWNTDERGKAKSDREAPIRTGSMVDASGGRTPAGMPGKHTLTGQLPAPAAGPVADPAPSHDGAAGPAAGELAGTARTAGEPHEAVPAHRAAPATGDAGPTPRHGGSVPPDGVPPPRAGTSDLPPAQQVRQALAPPATALQSLAGGTPSTLAQLFPAASAMLGGAHDRVRDLVADQRTRPPEPRASAPARAATPARPPPREPPRDAHRHGAPIEHTESAGRPRDAARSPGVSAGARPAVPLTGASDPAAADAHHQVAHQTLAQHLGHADRAAGRALGVERIPAPTVEPDRRSPPALGDRAQPLPPRTARAGGGDPQIEGMVAPRMAQKINAAAAGAHAAVAQSEAHAASFEAQRQAAAQHAASEQARVRTMAAQRTEGLRGQWHQANAQLHREHQALVTHKHEQVKATVQTSVIRTEREADQKLTETEHGADRELTAARSRADGIRAASRAHDHDQSHPGDPATGDADAQKVLDDAQRLVDQMLTAAKQHNLVKVEELRQQLAKLLADHAAQLQTFIEATLAKFPLIGKFYQQQIDELMTLVQADSATIAEARTGKDRELIDAWTDRLTHDLGLMKRYFGEVETIAQYDGDVDKLREAFGITFSGSNNKFKEEGTNYEEIALLAAISTEHAFRRSATAGQMDGFDFGKGFQAAFGQVDMAYNPTQPYSYPIVKQDADGLWYTYDTKGNRRQAAGKGFKSEGDAENAKGPYGGKTTGDHSIEFYPIAFNAGKDPPTDLLYNIIHEFGHVFDRNARRGGGDDLASETIEAMVDGKNTQIAGKNVARKTDEKYGMKPYPFQEDPINDKGEEFADMFLNWVEGSFADNDAGRARFAWMNQHMWGDTTMRGVEGQKRWGWADTAIDNNSGKSVWVNDVPAGGKDGHYHVQPGDTLQSIADKLKVKDPSVIQQANNMGASTDVSVFPVLIIPGVSDAQIAKLTTAS